MKKSIFTFLICFIFSALSIHAQDHTITMQGITFTPNDLTIMVGESVEWVNEGGTHNVNGSLQSFPNNPEGFNSGGPMAAPWTFSHTFTVPGVYDYQCDPHFSFGMTGKITVLGSTDGVIITEFMYNNPGIDDFEFIELYNNGSDAVDMENWTLSEAVGFTFPQFTLNAGEYVVITKSAAVFDPIFGVTSFQWDQNNSALNNTGETILLSDANGNFVDSVAYKGGFDGWPPTANGQGPSNVLCDYDGDNNDPFNWSASTTPTGFLINGTEVFADPGADSGCPAGPTLFFRNQGVSALENAGSLFIEVIMIDGNTDPTEATLEMNMASTADNVDDFELTLPMTITFDGSQPVDTQIVTVNLVDNGDIESTEVLILDLTNPTNNGMVSGNEQFTLTILDDDTPLTSAMVITGVFDTQVESTGLWAKGVEIQALEDIPDLSVFGVSSTNNGTGSTNGPETTLPPIAVSAGDCIYVANDSTLFFDFFGLFPTAAGEAANINGDDAIELYENNVVIDVFGDVDVDGTGEPWEYLDGWAYRKSGTGPDGGIFALDNWIFSGVDAFDGVANNSSAPNPFPTCSYSPVPPSTATANDDNVTTDINVAIIINILGNDILPIDLISLSVIDGPSNGDVVVNGLMDIEYTPDTDYCGPDEFTYEICDDNGCDQATVSITVECPLVYTPYDIATVTEVDDDGIPVFLEELAEITGIVHGIDLQGVNPNTGDPLDAIQFTLIDNTGGISVFSGDNFGYTVQEGDEVTIRGEIDEFRCLSQITPDTLWSVSTGNPLVTPAITAFLGEDFESELIQINNLSFVDINEWGGPTDTSFNVTVTNGANQFVMRIDNDNELADMPAPQEPFHAIGIGGQFNNQGNCLVGYQFLPRYMADIIPLNNTVEELANGISFYPNPVNDQMTIDTEMQLDQVTISNLLGQQVSFFEKPGNQLTVSDLQSGIYLITFTVGEVSWSSKFIKN